MNEPLESPVEDAELLRRYATEGSEAAFAELVRRRIGLVYSVALRQTRGDRHRAEDATQAVFTDLARKAQALAGRPVLAGWLYRSAQFAAAGLVRAESRRLAREQEAHTMEKDSASDEPIVDWEKIRPVLDEALNEIDERDRDAIVLRFFDGRAFGEIGAQLRTTENAARMRVDRALERLQSALARRGVTSTTAALGLVLAQQVAVAAPAGLAVSVTGAAVAAGATTVAAGWTATIMGMTKLQLGTAVAVATIGAGSVAMQVDHNADLRRELAAIPNPQVAMASVRAENQRLANALIEVEALRGDDVEYARLERSVGELRQAQKDAADRARRQAAIPAQGVLTLGSGQVNVVSSKIAAAPGNLTEVQRTVQDMDRAATERVDAMNREGNKLVGEFKELSEQSKNLALPEEMRTQAAAGAQQKLEEIKAKQREIQDFVAKARAEMNLRLKGDPAANPQTFEFRGGPKP
jgi:RNA polymerase sigma factor (sigma-70 family)